MKVRILQVLGVLLLASNVAWAQVITNGDFSAGNLGGWNVGGLNVTATNVDDANFNALLQITGAPAPVNLTAATIETDLTVMGETLDLDSIVNNSVTGGAGATAFNGVYLFQDFNVGAAGGNGSFRSGFDRGDGVDVAFAYVQDLDTGRLITITPVGGKTATNNNSGIPNPGGNDTVAEAIPEAAAGNPATDIGAADTGGTFTLATNTNGYRIGFVLLNGDNGGTTSDFGVDNVQFTNNPIPPVGGVPEIDANSAALPLAALGLILIVIGDGRRRKAMADL